MGRSGVTIDFNAELSRWNSSIDKLTKDLARFQSNASRTNRNVKKSFINLDLGGLAAKFGLAFSVASTLKLADAMTNLKARLSLVVSSASELADVQRLLFDISQETRVGLEQTVSLYTRMARSTKELKLSSAELGSVTETINKAIIISGASAENAAAALVQFGQGLSFGVLRGEELNSVLEQTFPLAEAIADGLGVTIQRLKEMGAAGELTTKKVFEGLQRSREKIDKEFLKMPITIGQAAGKMMTSLSAVISKWDEYKGFTSEIAGVIERVSRGINLGSNFFTGEKVSVKGRIDEVKRSIKNVESQMLSNIPILEIPYFKKEAERNIKQLASRLFELNEELVKLKKSSDDPITKLGANAGKVELTKKQLANYHTAMVATLGAEAAAVQKITEAYDTHRESVLERYKGQPTSSDELGDLAKLDAAEKRDLLDTHQKYLVKSKELDETRLSDMLDFFGRRKVAADKALEDLYSTTRHPIGVEFKTSDTSDPYADDDFMKARIDQEEAAFDQIEEKAQATADTMSEAFAGWAGNAASSLNDLLWEADKTFDDILISFGKMVTQMMIQKTIISPLIDSLDVAGGFSGIFKGLLPSYAVGTDYVPRDMIAMIHQGERIVPAAQNHGRGSDVSIVVNNRSDSDVSISQTKKTNGGVSIEMMIDKAVGKSLTSGAGAGVLRSQFGISPSLRTR